MLYAKTILNRLKKLIKEDFGLVYITIGSLGANFLSAFFWLILASLLTVDNYGQINYYIAMSNIGAGIGAIGLNRTVITFLSKGNEKIFNEANSITLITGLILAVVFSYIHWASGILSASLIFFSMTTAELLGRKKYREFAFVYIGQRIAQILFGMILYFQFDIIGLLVGYFLGALLFSYRYFFSLKKFSTKISNLKQKTGFVLHSYGYTLLGEKLPLFLDKVLVGAIFGYFSLGLYQLAFQFFMFVNILPGILSQYLLPEESSGKNKNEIKSIGLILATVFSLIMFFFSPYLIELFFPRYAEAILLIRIMSIAVIPSTIVGILTTVFLCKEKTKTVLLSGIIYLVSLITGLILMGLLIGTLGLALAILFSKIIQATYLYSQKKLLNTTN